MIKKKGMVNSSGQMELSTKDNGIKENSMVRAN
jgi:hypothetical protein